MFYIVTVTLLLLILPAGSVLMQVMLQNEYANLWFLVSKWFVFWGVGVRLFLAGIKQTSQPQFTAEKIFNIKNSDVFGIVREVGFANISMGALGLSTLFQSAWILPAALVGGLYYGLAGIGHMFNEDRNLNENFATITDLFISALLLVCFVHELNFAL